MGRRVYQRSGLSTYVERLYGLKDHEVALEFATQRLSFLQRYTATSLMRKWIRRHVHPVRKNVLARHPKGFSVVYGAIADALKRVGVRVETATAATRLKRANGGFILETGGWQREYEQVLSTIPVRATLQLLELPQEGEYEYMYLHSLFFRGRVVPGGGLFYNFTPRGAWKRATVFSRLYAEQSQEDHLTVEVTSHSADGTGAFVEEFIQHATELGFLREPRLVGSVVTPDAYPVFRRGRSAGRNVDRQRLQDAGIRLAGRQGRFEYLTSADAVRQAKGAVSK
jgi:protoporphyrinogen oxidase